MNEPARLLKLKSSRPLALLLRCLLAVYPLICLSLVFLKGFEATLYYSYIRDNIIDIELWLFAFAIVLNSLYLFTVSWKRIHLCWKSLAFLILSFLAFLIALAFSGLGSCFTTIIIGLQSMDEMSGPLVFVLSWLFSFHVSEICFCLISKKRIALLSALSRLLSIITFFIAAGILSNLFKDYHLGDHGDSESFFFHSYYALPCLLAVHILLSMLSVFFWTKVAVKHSENKIVFKWGMPATGILALYVLLYGACWVGCLICENRIEEMAMDSSSRYFSPDAVSSFKRLRIALDEYIMAKSNLPAEQKEALSPVGNDTGWLDGARHMEICHLIDFLSTGDVCQAMHRYFDVLVKSEVYYSHPDLLVFLKALSTENSRQNKAIMMTEEERLALGLLFSNNKKLLSEVRIDSFLLQSDIVLYPNRYPKEIQAMRLRECLYVDYDYLRWVFPVIPFSYCLWKYRLANEIQCSDNDLQKSATRYCSKVFAELQKLGCVPSSNCENTSGLW